MFRYSRVITAASLILGLASSLLAQGNSQAKKFPQVVASVNGEQITGAELESIIQQIGKNQDPLGTAQNRLQMERDAALAMLIDDLLMQQFIRQNTPAVPDALVNQKMAEMAAELKKQGKTLQGLCKETQQTEAQLKKTLRLKLQWGNYAQSQIKEEHVKNYYSHFKDFFDGHTVQVALIVLRTPPGVTAAEKTRMGSKMQDLRKQIIEGKMDFAFAAKTYSQDPSSAAGGNLGYVPRKYALEEPLAQVAFRLGSGQVSEVISLDMGLFLLRVLDRKPGRGAEYQKIKEDVRDFCLEDFFQDTLVNQRKLAKIEIFLR
ncbi:MAG: hypothetical protein EXR99_14645 [Gemmataceae bacterium]|nr:hypothetical protein [Gemmataceae bacterium]